MRPWITILGLVLGIGLGFPMPSFADEELTPHALIDQALKAAGGVEKIRQFKAVALKAVMTSPGMEEKAVFRCLFAAHNLFRLELDGTKGAKGLIVCGGDTVWGTDDKKGFQESSVENDDFWVFMQIIYALSLPDQLIALKRKEYQLKIVEERAVNGVQAVAMRVKHKRHPEVTIYFDKATHLPVKSEMIFKVPVPKNQFQVIDANPPQMRCEVFFDGWKTFQGVRHFTKVKIRLADEIIQTEIREIKLLKKYDPGAFKKPK